MACLLTTSRARAVASDTARRGRRASPPARGCLAPLRGGEGLADEAGAGDEGAELGAADPARGELHATVGVQPELLRADVAQGEADALGDVVGGLAVEGLLVDDAGGELFIAAELGPEVDLG